MKKKKIVAGLLSAAMIATSILPGGGLFQPLTASAAVGKWTPSPSTIDLNSGQQVVGSITGSGIEHVNVNDVKVVENNTGRVGTLTWTTSSIAVRKAADQSILLTASAIQHNSDTWGKNTLDVVSGSSATVLASVPVTAKTNVVTASGVTSYTRKDNTLTGSLSNIKFTGSKGETVPVSYVNSDFTYNWAMITATQAKKTEAELKSELSVSTWTEGALTMTIPVGTRNQHYAILAVPKTGITTNNIKLVTTDALSYVNTSSSNKSTTTTTTDSNGTTTTTGGGAGAGGSTTTTTTTTDTATGTTTTTTDTTNADGSTVKETVVENADGSKTTTTVETAADGSVKETVVQENTDGTKVETVSETKADGTTIQSKTETAADGSSKSTKLTRRANGSAQKVISTVAANGASTVVTIEESKDGASEIINEVTDASGNTTAMDYTLPAGSNKLTLNTITTTAKTVKVPASIKIQAEVSLSKLSLKADTLSAEGKALKVTKIGKAALKGNKTATKLVIGKNVKSIGAQAFQGVSKLKTVNIKGNVTTIGKNSFKNINKKATIKIKATAKQYKAMVKKIKNAKKGNAPKKVTYKRVK